MGVKFGGGGKKSQPALNQRRSGEILLDSLFPGFNTGAQRGGGESQGVSGQLSSFLDQTGQPTTSVLAGIPGVDTSTRLPGGGVVSGNALNTAINSGSQVPDFAQGGGSLLPSINELGRFDTLFQKQEAGTLTPFENKILDQTLQTVTQGIDPFGKDFIDQLNSLGAPVSVGADGVGRVNVEDIGTITSTIVGNLPPEFQTFLSSIFNDSTPQAIDRELNNLSDKLLADSQRSADTLGTQLLSTFAQQGIGTSGAAIEAMKKLATDVSIATNAQIAAARVNALDTLATQRQLGIQAVNILTQAGAQEQANRVQAQLGEIDARTRVLTAQISQQTQLQQTLIAAKTQLEQSRINLLGDTLGLVAQGSNAQEAARITALNKPFDILTSLATGGQTGIGGSQGGGSGFDLSGAGPLLGGIAAITAPGALLSDRSLKDNIAPLTHSLSKINELEPVTFTCKHNLKDDIGFIAQDFAKVFPELVGIDENTGHHYLRLDHNILARMVKAIQELTDKVEQLEKR